MKLLKNNPYIVGVSGGPDSIFLVHWLWEHGYRNLVLAHVNYHWRKDSNRDQEIVELLGHKLNLPVEIKSLNTSQQKPRTINFEAWARDERYNFFSSLLQKYPKAIVTVGHQENDLIESYLMQKQRLSIVNYYGLKELTSHHQSIIWRPLLKYKKSEILEWLAINKIDYALDITNKDLTLKRNKIRSELQEVDFPAIRNQIHIDNQNNQKQSEVVKHYLKKNQQDQSLFLSSELKQWDSQSIERLIFNFFESQAFENKLLDRKKQLLKELSGRILKSKKNFWSVDLGPVILIKDYDFLHFLNHVNLPELQTNLKGKSDFSKLKKFKNKDQIIDSISHHQYRFPYIIYRLDSPQIKGVKWRKKSLAKVLAENKMSYKNRLKTGIIYNLTEGQFLDYWDW